MLNLMIEFEGIKHAIDIAEPGDTVVLASKGREPYQIMDILKCHIEMI